MVQGIFKIALCLRDRHVFMWQSVKILNVFNTLTLRQIFCKMKSFCEKLVCCFSVESTRIENASFPYKTAISEANVETNRMVTTKWNGEWIFAKNRVLPVTTLVFWKFYSSLRTSYKELTWCTSNPNAHTLTLCKRWSYI